MGERLFGFLKSDISKEIKINEKNGIFKIVEGEKDAKLKEVNLLKNKGLEVFGMTLDETNSKKRGLFGYLEKQSLSVDGIFFVTDNYKKIYVLHIELKSDSPVKSQVNKKFMHSLNKVEQILKDFDLKENIDAKKKIDIKIEIIHRFILIQHTNNSRIKSTSGFSYQCSTEKLHKYYKLEQMKISSPNNNQFQFLSFLK